MPQPIARPGRRVRTAFLRCTLLSSLVTLLATMAIRGASPAPASIYRLDNLVAWCIVPFDARQRTPAQRAEMVQRLGITKVAYDWREQHVATFEDEILQYQKHHIEFFAFWSWHDAIEPLLRKYDLHPQIWIMLANSAASEQSVRVREAAEQLLPMVDKTRSLGCPLGIYNHGGWGGDPQNMIAVCRYLREHHQADHVGLVYNLHHGHEHMQDFAEHMTAMQPYLLCVNINGMADLEVVRQGRDKILPLGTGTHERRLLHVIADSGYDGPIGILDHREDTDAEESLRSNLDGLQEILSTWTP